MGGRGCGKVGISTRGGANSMAFAVSMISRRERNRIELDRRTHLPLSQRLGHFSCLGEKMFPFMPPPSPFEFTNTQFPQEPIFMHWHHQSTGSLVFSYLFLVDLLPKSCVFPLG